MEKKRNWKEYEAKLMAKKAKLVDFWFRKPTKKQLDRELAKMNRSKPGRIYKIPESVIGFSVFMKTSFKMDDRQLALFLRKTFGRDIKAEKLDHSSIVKRRKYLKLTVPYDFDPASLKGKTIYFDGMCLRVGRGGNYRSRKYGTEVKYLRIGVFTDDEGKPVDFTIGDEHDAEIEMIREKLPAIEKSGAAAFVVDGIGSAKDVVCRLVKGNIRPIIKASKPVVASMETKPPPYQCIKEKKEEELIWEEYVRGQQDYEKWRKETGYSMRWVFSEGIFSSFKRMYGEELVCRTQKTMHDEICAKFMLLEGSL
ncbi:MAG: hypothetical protein ACOYVJ_03940, partial [Nitrospirota bacterium]